MTGPLLQHPLVSTQWLADHLGADDLLIVDASVLRSTQPGGAGGYLSGHESYLLNGHLPGAVFADLIEKFSDVDGAFPFTRPSAEAFAQAASVLGVGPDTSVIVYDAAVGHWAARLWWLLRSFGHDRVAVLDGGLTKWIAEGRDTELGHVEPSPARFLAVQQPGFWADKADVEAIVRGDAAGALVCGSPAADFDTRGHIPGSLSVPAARLVDAASNAVLPEPALRDAFAPVLGRRIVTYCGGGIAAAADALALTLLGHRDVAVYDGSLSEWTADPQAPLSTRAVA